MKEEPITKTNDTDIINNSWLAELPEGIRESASLTKFKDIGALAQSYLEAEKALSSRVTLPKEDSSDEEWSKFYARLGVPEDKRYLDQRTAEDEEYLQAYEEMFYNQGLSKKQGAKLLESMYKFSDDLQKKQLAKLEEIRASNLDWLKNNYGGEYEGKMALMQAALGKFGSRELAGLVEETNYHPALVDLLVKVGGTLQSDLLVTGQPPAGIMDAKSALQEIKKLESDEEFMVKLRSKNHVGHQAAVGRMEELYKIAYNN